MTRPDRLVGLALTATGGESSPSRSTRGSRCAWRRRGSPNSSRTRFGKLLAPTLTYLVGYGPLLRAITFGSYIKEFRGTAQVWDKTEKVGRVMA